MTGIDGNTFNVAIVGGGPAGSSLAIRLAMTGLSVLLVEEKRFPREKLCGEFVSPECFSHFAELGVMSDIEAANPTELRETVLYSRNGRGASIKSKWFGQNGSLAIGLSRAEMDRLLLERARTVGVDIRESTKAAGLISDKEIITGLKLRNPNGAEYNVSAKVIVDATGRTRSLARRFRKLNIAAKPADHIAFKTHLRGANIAANTCEIYTYRGGYGGCNKVENDLFNLCFIVPAKQAKNLDSDAERLLKEIVFTNKRAAETMKDVEIVKPWLAVPIEHLGPASLVPAAGLITVGDAAAFIDPFTGSGILLALESSKIASKAIIRALNNGADFDQLATDYRAEYASAFGMRLRICSALRYAANIPFLGDATISMLSLSSGLRRTVARATRFNAKTVA